jgi:hypothetical protein
VTAVLHANVTVIGGWKNKRSRYLWNNLGLELDKTDFSFGQGYFLRFNASQERTTQMSV